MQILLVEDDYALASGLQQALQNEGFVVNTIATGEAAIHIIQTDPPNMVILDIGLPDISGLKVLQKIRPSHPTLPVLILTARDRVEDKVAGLDCGADDYLVKPFDMPNSSPDYVFLNGRLGTAHSNIITLGDVSINTESHHVTVEGEELELSRREYMLLKALMENAGKIQSKDSLESKLYSWGEEVSSNTIEVHIHHLRKKLNNDLNKNRTRYLATRLKK